MKHLIDDREGLRSGNSDHPNGSDAFGSSNGNDGFMMHEAKVGIERDGISDDILNCAGLERFYSFR